MIEIGVQIKSEAYLGMEGYLYMLLLILIPPSFLAILLERGQKGLR
jgi:hypothetical protein